MYTVRVLANWYSMQEMKVKWENKVSLSFGVQSTARKYALTKSFNLYIDDLLQQLQSCGVGARL